MTLPLPEPFLESVDYELWGQNMRSDVWSREQILAYGAACRAAALEEAATVAEKCGYPVGAGDGCTFVPGDAASAARAIRSLKESHHG